LIWIRVVTWAAIVVNWVLIVWLARLLRRSRQTNDRLARDVVHSMILSTEAVRALVKENSHPDLWLPEETVRWMEEKNLEHMVYGDE
jgi:hypothetical protein